MALNLWDAQGQHLLAPDLTGWLAAEGERSGTFLPSKHIKWRSKSGPNPLLYWGYLTKRLFFVILYL